MAHKTLDPRHAIESCAFQLHSWRPFHIPTTHNKALDSSDSHNSKPYANGVYSKRPCLSDRATLIPIDSLDMSKLSLFDDDRTIGAAVSHKRGSLPLIARKRRRRGSRSVSGRSSDRSGTRLCCSVGGSAAHATCSDFPVAAGTDSSGELFVNGDANWASDVSEAAKNSREREGGSGERENLGGGLAQFGVYDAQGNESGYGSEPGYRGDAEFGYGDEFDEEEEDQRLLFWGDRFGDTDSNMEVVGENTFSEQKAHHRCRRKKQDWRMVGPLG